MKKHHFKIRTSVEGEHVRATVFSGNDGETLANCGELCFRMGEWQLFGALLCLGYTAPGTFKNNCLLTFEGDKEMPSG